MVHLSVSGDDRRIPLRRCEAWLTRTLGETHHPEAARETCRREQDRGDEDPLSPGRATERERNQEKSDEPEGHRHFGEVEDRAVDEWEYEQRLPRKCFEDGNRPCRERNGCGGEPDERDGAGCGVTGHHQTRIIPLRQSPMRRNMVARELVTQNRNTHWLVARKPRRVMPLDLDLSKLRFGTELLKGGVVMDVTNAEQALIAEEAGAVAVMALERVPADIRAAGGVARMADPVRIQEIMDAVTVPVMAKCRIGHDAEARALESLGADMIDESEVLTPADPFFHVNKRAFEVPFVCGARSLGEAVRRIWEGAAMIRTKGEAGTGDVVEAVRHIRLVTAAIAELKAIDNDRLLAVATKFSDSYTRLLKEVRTAHGQDASVQEADVVFAGATLDDITEGTFQLLTEIKKIQRLPVVNFAAGGVATPADAALMMLMGCDGVFVGSGIFKAENPETRGRAIVDAVAHFDDPSTVAEVSKGIGLAMKGLDVKALPIEARLQDRGW